MNDYGNTCKAKYWFTFFYSNFNHILFMFNKAKTLLVNISISFGTIVILLVSIGFFYDIYFRNFFKKPVPYTTGTLFKATHSDTLLGYRPNGNTFSYGKKMFLDTTVYSMAYHLDSYGHRFTPNSLVTNEKFAAFLGCSFTFGDGLNDNETIPFYFSKNSKIFNGYNFGYSGYGPNQALIKLQHDSLNKIITEKDGIGFYVFIHDHINRTIGSMSNFMINKGRAPCFEIEGEDLVYKGLFINVYPRRSSIYKKMGENGFCRYFKIGHPFKLGDKHFELTGRVLEEVSKEFQKEFHNNNFYVIMYPSISQEDYEADEKIIKFLKKKNIKYLDYRKLFNPTTKVYSIHHDNHPTAFANDILTKQMVKDLKL